MKLRFVLFGLAGVAAVVAGGLLWANRAGPDLRLPDGVSVIAVPSGQAVYLQDTITDAPGPNGLAMRFRFVAPGIAQGGGVGFDAAVADMAALCTSYALPRLAQNGPLPSQIIISMAEKPTLFGEADPEVVQFFEAYSIKDATCIWSAF